MSMITHHSAHFDAQSLIFSNYYVIKNKLWNLKLIIISISIDKFVFDKEWRLICLPIFIIFACQTATKSVENGCLIFKWIDNCILNMKFKCFIFHFFCIVLFCTRRSAYAKNFWKTTYFPSTFSLFLSEKCEKPNKKLVRISQCKGDFWFVLSLFLLTNSHSSFSRARKFSKKRAIFICLFSFRKKVTKQEIGQNFSIKLIMRQRFSFNTLNTSIHKLLSRPKVKAIVFFVYKLEISDNLFETNGLNAKVSYRRWAIQYLFILHMSIVLALFAPWFDLVAFAI